MQKNKIISITLGLAVVLIAGIVALNQPRGKNDVPPVTPTPTADGYTLAQVAMHSDLNSCWTAVNGNVYDVTGWIAQHPGGEQAILSICGKDGSSAFNDQHANQRRPADELAGFKIGAVAVMQ